MTVVQSKFQVSTRGECDVIDITAQVVRAVRESRIRTGLANVSGRGSTLGISTIEYESGCISDLKRALDNVAPPDEDYAHNARWGDGNGYAHLRSALMGTVKSFPIEGGELGLGVWQQIILCDFDNRPRTREITVTVIGE